MTRQNLTPDEILWTGRQWAVTTYGLETIGEPYHYSLAAGQLDDMRASNGKLDMPIHMMEKEWLDVDDFLTTYLVAIALHGLRIRPATLRASLKAAIAERHADFTPKPGQVPRPKDRRAFRIDEMDDFLPEPAFHGSQVAGAGL